ncbi:hypothetical protein WM40_24430 [Robbsia andropogonis]|uniref:Uncharacterized protein n=1 Tax=Robbsia andropogonis TaxID=28092 RepID=A0A0F5JUA0_9BURK|nr:hypothetical protein [Robbsia andropogonis]KKB61225.1 hypothetical protein WM40_24430 [Robbsia andropogonis]MCP1121184.1 hypothetical protein [Robbsia andropogonis]MCP1130976.1 hypothetical protein [Robbsia andropogonis]
MNDALVQNVATQIAHYLQMNPVAADTVEGIHHFWVGAQSAQHSLDVTQAALEYLLARGEVVRIPIGNRILWHAPRDGG